MNKCIIYRNYTYLQHYILNRCVHVRTEIKITINVGYWITMNRIPQTFYPNVRAISYFKADNFLVLYAHVTNRLRRTDTTNNELRFAAHQLPILTSQSHKRNQISSTPKLPNWMRDTVNENIYLSYTSDI